MPESLNAGKRGPQADPDRGSPCGFRLTARQRFELGMAAQFLGTGSVQETLEVAVNDLDGREEFLDKVSAFLAA